MIWLVGKCAKHRIKKGNKVIKLNIYRHKEVPTQEQNTKSSKNNSVP